MENSEKTILSNEFGLGGGPIKLLDPCTYQGMRLNKFTSTNQEAVYGQIFRPLMLFEKYSVFPSLLGSFPCVTTVPPSPLTQGARKI